MVIFQSWRAKLSKTCTRLGVAKDRYPRRFPSSSPTRQNSEMDAWAVHHPGPIENEPLQRVERRMPTLASQVRIKVNCCGVCRTDLHLAEGDLPPKRQRHPWPRGCRRCRCPRRRSNPVCHR